VLRLLRKDLDPVNLGPARALLAEPHHRVDIVGLPLEHSFNGAIGPVGDPAGHPSLLGEPPCGVPKEDTLDPAVDDDASPDHSGYFALLVLVVVEARDLGELAPMELVDRDGRRLDGKAGQRAVAVVLDRMIGGGWDED
jgi:hypothetical protein